ncbi:hypothetical protein K431DRAFT_340156 [Polychaeton citri CBS 116435]|uniref:Class E vacuolar protein-sorting machinery protein HSE1 n=1 Tax=Polychaeton citri CBS 116435 TaxID=1314669 RepID=A0A9P4Q706_9PEZI|nr:hypothetical protein K431DRAFT_340156 [Polychaeton citri CBS 116435]
MFRTQANPMDDLVGKATDENLTSENWEYILDVCDKVGASPSGPAHAVSALIKRLAHRNANVQLYTLELANALSQNCGADLHRELASKAFTDALLRLAADRNTHAQVKQKVLERMSTWTEEFRKNPELGIMEQAFGKLRQSQPALMPPPSKPGKREISSEDRAKEDEELQMALALSVQDNGAKGAGGAAAGGSGGTVRDDSEPLPATNAQAGNAAGTTAATVSRVRALYDFTPSEPGELAFRKNDIIAVLESVFKDWWKGSLRGQTGIFPLNYVEKLQDPTKEEMERDAGMEAEVFGEIRSVEKLLALLSVREGGSRRGEREEEEISELYQRTLSIRPKLIELIGKYSQKKDDFTQLNEKFIKARRDYEALLDSSMSQPQYSQQFPIRQQPPGNRQSYAPPHLQQGPYGQQPPQGYPPQGPPPSAAYPPQQPYAAQSHQHLPPHTQDPSQRYFSPVPSEAPPQQPQQQQQQQQQPPQTYGSQYQPPPPNGAPASAPFHFIPGGVQPGAPPSQQPPQQQEIRRKPSPANTLQAAQTQPQATAPPPQPAGAPSDPYGPPTSAGAGPPPQLSAGPPPSAPPPGPPGGNFQGQIRPNSIHTLNSGNPQELATSGYESPVDNRHSYHQPLPLQGPVGYEAGYGIPPQRRGSYDSPGSVYSGATGVGGMPAEAAAGYHPYGGQAQPPLHPQGSGGGYQAYTPGAVAGGTGGSSGGADPGDFYR